MLGHHIVIPVHLHGTLAADASGRFSLPFNATLVAVQAVGSGASDATLLVGTTDNDDEYLTAFAIGDSEVPVTKSWSDFVGGMPPYVAEGTVVEWLLDFDGAAGTAAANVTILFTFAEGI